jgi:glycosyltransferase involved in cell wall biosynthesis
MTNNLPLVTIGITCFNAEKTIMRAVSSAINQDWPNLEILIVDDASTDGSWKILNDISVVSKNIKTIRHKTNRGFASGLNTIIHNAGGEFIAFIDDDDESDPKRISTQLKRIADYECDHHCDLVFCYSNRKIVLHGGTMADQTAMAIGRYAPEPHGPVVADYIFGFYQDQHYIWGMFGSGTMLARRSSLLKVGGYDDNFRRCAEWDMAVRAAFAGAHFIAVNEPLMTQYKTATPDKANKTPLKYALLLRYKHKEYLKQRHAYLYSLIYAHAKYYYARGLRLLFRLATLLLFILRPRLVWRQWITAKVNRHTGSRSF